MSSMGRRSVIRRAYSTPIGVLPVDIVRVRGGNVGVCRGLDDVSGLWTPDAGERRPDRQSGGLPAPDFWDVPIWMCSESASSCCPHRGRACRPVELVECEPLGRLANIAQAVRVPGPVGLGILRSESLPIHQWRINACRASR